MGARLRSMETEGYCVTERLFDAAECAEMAGTLTPGTWPSARCQGTTVLGKVQRE